MNTITIHRHEIDEPINEAQSLDQLAREVFTIGLRKLIDSYNPASLVDRSQLLDLRKVAEAYNDHEAVSDIDFILKYGK